MQTSTELYPVLYKFSNSLFFAGHVKAEWFLLEFSELYYMFMQCFYFVENRLLQHPQEEYFNFKK